MSMPVLKSEPTLSQLQNYVADIVKERGFQDETVSEMFMLLLKECGAFAKAARKAEGTIKTDQSSRHFDIDLEVAFREKEAINNKRSWK